MKDACFVVTLVAVAVSVNIALSNAQGISPISLLPVISCAATSCIKGQICRIVVRADGRCAPQCLDPKHVPRSGRSQLCGTSGHPVLVERKTYLRASRPSYSTFRVDEERPCPSKDLVKRNRVCCAETQKEGVCPAPASVEIRKTSCRGDNQCRGNEKCCQNARGGNTCADPITSKLVCNSQNCIPGIPCAIVDCVPGSICVETPTGATCKQGTPTDCTVIDCPPDFRCIDLPTGSECVPLSTCAVRLCQVGASCVNTPNGSECQPMTDICQLPKDVGPCKVFVPSFFFNSATQQCESFVFGGCRGNKNRFSTLAECVAACHSKVAICPQFRCPGRQCAGSDECQRDLDCKGNLKCCKDCSGCRKCLTPTLVFPPPLSCLTAKCSLGFECIETPQGPNCVPQINKPGMCPAPFLIEGENAGLCGRPCVNDSSCEGLQKCCTAGSCGLVCRNTLPASTCASRLCVVGTICVETPNGAECRPVNKPGECPPPFTIPGASSGRCARPCVNDSSCEGTQKCCTAGACGLVCSDPLPAPTCASRFCGPGTTCVETPNGAECRPDVCSLSPVVGPCEALIPSFYYDPRSESCKPFNYGGCQGNANRFTNRRSCERACGPLRYVIG